MATRRQNSGAPATGPPDDEASPIILVSPLGACDEPEPGGRVPVRDRLELHVHRAIVPSGSVGGDEQTSGSARCGAAH